MPYILSLSILCVLLQRIRIQARSFYSLWVATSSLSLFNCGNTNRIQIAALTAWVETRSNHRKQQLLANVLGVYSLSRTRWLQVCGAQCLLLMAWSKTTFATATKILAGIFRTQKAYGAQLGIAALCQFAELCLCGTHILPHYKRRS